MVPVGVEGRPECDIRAEIPYLNWTLMEQSCDGYREIDAARFVQFVIMDAKGGALTGRMGIRLRI